MPVIINKFLPKLQKDNKSALLPNENKAEMTQNQNDALIKTKILNIFIQKNEEKIEKSPKKSYTIDSAGKNRRISFFSAFQRGFTMKNSNSDENSRKKSIKSVEPHIFYSKKLNIKG